MSDSPGAFDDAEGLAFPGPPDDDEVRRYILDMVAQLSQIAAVHGLQDLATFLAAPPQDVDAESHGVALN